MRRHTWPAFLALFVEAVPVTHDVDREGVTTGHAMADEVVLAVDFFAAFGAIQLIAQQAEHRDTPKIARFGGRRGIRLQTFEFALENAPVILCIRPSPYNLVLHLRIS